MRSTNARDENEFNAFLTRWNRDTTPQLSKRKGFARRRPLTQQQRDDARDAVESMRSRMKY